jgi:uncharacterized protein (DUF1015 family)
VPGRALHNSSVADVRPFAALRYDVAVAGPLDDLLCPPYDVIGDAERDALYERSPYNFVRIEFPRPNGDPYAEAAATLSSWRMRNLLRLDQTAALYVHDHEFAIGGARVRRRGVYAALRLHAPEETVVMPHELTFPKAKADRLALLHATRTNTSAIFGMFADTRGEIAGTLDRAIGGGSMKPLAEATIGAEHHRLWAIGDRLAIEELRDAFAKRRIYIADGHHRYETALAYLTERGSASPDAPIHFVLAYLCGLDDPGLRILATHRIVRGDGAELDRAIERSFARATIDAGAIEDTQPGIVIVRNGTFEELELRPQADVGALRAAWRALPVAQAEELLLKDARQQGAEITYEHDAKKAIAAAESGATAILLRAVDPQTLQQVADAGERLPQKTTYFYPKVPAGLVVRALD